MQNMQGEQSEKILRHDIDDEFRKMVIKKKGDSKEAMQEALQEAVELWIKENS